MTKFIFGMVLFSILEFGWASDSYSGEEFETHRLEDFLESPDDLLHEGTIQKKGSSTGQLEDCKIPVNPPASHSLKMKPESKIEDLPSPLQVVTQGKIEIRPIGLFSELLGDQAPTRPMILVKIPGLSYTTPVGTINEWIPFYQSTGSNSHNPKAWFPFTGNFLVKRASDILPIWIMKTHDFDKNRFMIEGKSISEYPSIKEATESSKWENFKKLHPTESDKTKLKTAFESYASRAGDDPVFSIIADRLNSDLSVDSSARSLKQTSTSTEYPLPRINENEANRAIATNNFFGINLSTIPKTPTGNTEREWAKSQFHRLAVKNKLSNLENLEKALLELDALPTVLELQSNLDSIQKSKKDDPSKKLSPLEMRALSPLKISSVDGFDLDVLLLQPSPGRSRAREKGPKPYSSYNASLPNPEFFSHLPLHLAVRNGDAKLVETQLQTGKKPNQPDENGNTPLHRAVEGNHPVIADILLKANADPNQVNRAGQTPLHAAAAAPEKISILKTLLDSKTIHINQLGYFGTALSEAVFMGNKEAVKVLLEKGANPDLKAAYAPLPVEEALSSKNIEIFKLLVHGGAELKAPGLLDKAVLSNDPIFLETLLETKGKWDVNQRNSRGYLPLEVAITTGNPQIVKMLLNKGASRDIQGQYKKPFFRVSLMMKHRNASEIAKIFFDKKDCETEPRKESSLRAAIRASKPDMVKFLLDNCEHIDLNHQAADGLTALDAAIVMDNSSLIETLLNKGADPNGNGESKMPPLVRAALQINKKLALKLVEKGADIAKAELLLNSPAYKHTEDYNYAIRIIESIKKLQVDQKTSDPASK